jgi:ParB/Sulfiredoxin domain
MENTEAIWTQRLKQRLDGTPWIKIIKAEGERYGGTFTRYIKQAREKGWVPPEADLPPARRSDGKRQGVRGQHQEVQRSAQAVDLEMASIALDAGTQMRVKISEVTVGQFADEMRAGDQFPPVVVFSEDNSSYILADGFHRHAAHKTLGYLTIAAEVKRGGLDAAIDYACECNNRHGLRPSIEDRQKAVKTQLTRHPERGDREIARRCGCSASMVGKYRGELHSPTPLKLVKKPVHLDSPSPASPGQQPVHLDNHPPAPSGKEPAETDDVDMEADPAAWLDKAKRVLETFHQLRKESSGLSGVALLSERWPIEKRRELSSELRWQANQLLQIATYVDDLAEKGRTDG